MGQQLAHECIMDGLVFVELRVMRLPMKEGAEFMPEVLVLSLASRSRAFSLSL